MSYFHDRYNAVHGDGTKSNGHIFRLGFGCAVGFDRHSFRLYLFHFTIISIHDKTYDFLENA